jgi:hypothetical protein
MALTTPDLLNNPTLLERARARFSAHLQRGEVAGREAWLEHGKEFAPTPRR